MHPRAQLPLLAAVLAMVVGACGVSTPGEPATDSGDGAAPTVTATPRPTARPIPGHELYGYIPYWEMDADLAQHVAEQDYSTLALFSVTARRDGSLNPEARGYRAITGEIGRRLVREARQRGVHVELVFSSFGDARNQRLFGGPIETQDLVIESLVSFADEHRFDGINVDVEVLDRSLIPAFEAFLVRLRERWREVRSEGQVSVATGANVIGSEMAAAATRAGVDRIFLMGYDYHWSGSAPGASAPLERRDGDEKDLVWSLDLYEALGVPVDRTLLGLPFYGMSWPVQGPEIGATRTGRGSAWVPADHRGFLRRPPVEPVRDEIEVVDVYAVPTEPDSERPSATPDVAGEPTPSGSVAGEPTPSGSVAGEQTPSGSMAPTSAGSWEAIYVDSPETLTPKLRLANDRGLAGAGFWAVGFERGLPGYQQLIDAFRRDELPEP